MYSFDAYFRNNEVYINKKHQYLTNETLVQILNLDIENLKKMREELPQLCRKLVLQNEMLESEINRYNDCAQEAQRVMHRLDALARAISLYEKSMDAAVLNRDQLFDCLNTIRWVWENSDNDEEAFPSEDNEYGLYLYEEDTAGPTHYFYNTIFIPGLEHDIDDTDMILSLEKFNSSLKALFGRYLAFVDDLLRVKLIYTDFIDNYLNGKNKFLNEYELAKVYGDFVKKSQPAGGKPYMILSSGNSKMSHAVLEDDKGRNILCESYHFETLGAFLYLDLFHGIKSNFIPKRCLNCNRYFLIEAGKYSDYCEEPLADDNTKTCRDIGARKKYGDKCKNDPVWLAYNRAYKAHYARYMKKKMTVAEFEQWSARAVEIRTQAENGGIAFEEYEWIIKK